MQISVGSALEKLRNTHAPFIELFGLGTLSVEFYKPVGVDKQQPHEKDEVYVVVAGHGDFVHGNTKSRFLPGDLLFVPAHMSHRFENFSDDFCTWVIFFGLAGGEANSKNKK